MEIQTCWGRKSSLKEGREYHGCGDECNVFKREKGSKIIFPIIIKLFERILSWEEGKGAEMLGKKIKI